MSRPAADTLLDPEVISKAEALGLHARYVVEGYMAGEHKSPYRGFAIEFAQHREYSHGDDTRHLDWKVVGRTDRTASAVEDRPISTVDFLATICKLMNIDPAKENRANGVDRPIPIVDTTKKPTVIAELL